jgi:beta-glucosidase
MAGRTEPRYIFTILAQHSRGDRRMRVFRFVVQRPLATAAVFLACVSAARPAALRAQASANVERLIQAMTLDEKIAMLHGAQDPQRVGQAGYLPGVERLGIPPLRMTDGPAGVRIPNTPAMAMPAPIAGRNFETLGEDPLLAARIVGQDIKGIQGEGLIATVKHYAANHQDNARQSVSANVDDRTLHEIYLPGFESAIKAGAWSVMCAYNRVNTVYACESPQLLTDILRKEFGLTGWVVSDWGATQMVTVHVGARELSYWSPQTRAWTVASGSRALVIGSSSRDIRLRGALQVSAPPGGE